MSDDDPVSYIDEPSLPALTAFTDLIEYGVPNGGYTNPPPTPASNLDTVSSGGDNVLPGWTHTLESGASPTFKVIASAVSPSAFGVRGTYTAGGASDSGFIQAIIDVGGDTRGDFPHHGRLQMVAGGANTASFTGELTLQYLDASQATTGMPSERVLTIVIAAGATTTFELDATTAGITPTTARYLRIRLRTKRAAAAIGATGTIDFLPVRVKANVSKQIFTANGTWYKPASCTWVQVTVFGAGGGGASGRRGAAGTVRAGGGGGCGGASAIILFAASDLPDSVAVLIGAGGAGAAAPTSDNTDGTSGSGGAQTIFGSYLAAAGGPGGAAGTAVAAVGTAAVSGMFDGSVGSATSVTGPGNDGPAGRLTASGGSGCGLNAANSPGAGGAGGIPYAIQGGLLVPPAGGAGGSSGSVGQEPYGAIGGSGGGGAGTNGSGSNLAAGGRAAGGGGGGGRLNGGTGKAGASGGDGYCAVVAW